MRRWCRTLCWLLLLCLGLGASLRTLAASGLGEPWSSSSGATHCHPVAMTDDADDTGEGGPCLPDAGCGHCGACVFGALLPSPGAPAARPLGHAPWMDEPVWRANSHAAAVPTPPPRSLPR